ncbi:MAG: hypothetical protein EOO52_16035 [Gammaproteobacteria bacterium]|nr:MAG: hypothetical protein EOO52_16035 [Gammaproteobacteria bacterium]
MNINNIVINTRTRSPWQAINLGVALARSWFWPMFLSWVIPSGVVAIAVAFAFPGLASWLPMLLVWWLKPLWDRGPLFIASRRLFDENISFKSMLKEFKRIYLKDILMSLTLRRFSITRSYDLPVTCLEGLDGNLRSARLTVLHREGTSESTWAMMVLLHIELMLVISVFSLSFLFIPEQFLDDAFQFMKRDISLGVIIYNVLYFFSMAVIGPFYAVCGFSQYINRRIGLEGWGIELQFRELLNRRKAASLSAAALFGLGLIGFIFLSSPTAVYADESESASISHDSSFVGSYKTDEQLRIESTIKDVLKDDVFHQMQHSSSIRFKNTEKIKNDDVPQWLISFIEYLEKHEGSFKSLGKLHDGIVKFFGSTAKFIEVIIWCVVISLIIWVMYVYREFFKRVLHLPSKTNVQSLDEPEHLFGLDVRSSSLPDNPLDLVDKLWRAKEHREAISLLYRTTLIHLMNERGLSFRSGFTEEDCLVLVSKKYPDAPLIRYFSELNKVWEMIAYAHRIPAAEKVEFLLTQWTGMIKHG